MEAAKAEILSLSRLIQPVGLSNWTYAQPELQATANARLLGGDLSVRPGGVKLGYVPDVGPGGRVGIDYDLEGSQYFLTSRGYLDDVGLDTFGETYAPDGVLQDMYFESGHLNQRLGGWVSGLEMLRIRVCIQWEIQYKEVPQ